MTLFINRAFLSAFALFLLLTSSFVSLAQTKSSGLSKALDSNGRLRSEAVGSFNTEGYTMKQGPNGEPLFVKDGLDSPLASTCSDPWDIRFTGQTPNSSIESVVIAPDGSVYIGGNFTVIGDKSANRVAKWNGVAWSALGSGLDGGVRNLELDADGNLYVVGDFRNAGGVTAGGIAKWDGTSWSPIGTGAIAGVLGWVFDVEVFSSSEIYVIGHFDGLGGVAAPWFAKWNGTSWGTVGTSPNDSGRSLLRDGNILYVGGTFTQIGGISANRIAKLDLSNPASPTYSALGSGLGLWALSIAKDTAGNIYAGGNFTTSPGGYIAKWDGSTWTALGGGVNGFVWRVFTVGNEVYVGGDFTSAGTGGGAISTPRIAKWNGTSWVAIGSGLSSRVSAFAYDGTSLYVGGSFTSTDAGTPLAYFGRWNGSSWSEVGEDATGRGWLGANGSIQRILKDNSGNIYVAGNFSKVGDVTASRIAKWDGLRWSAIGAGVNGLVRDMIWGPEGDGRQVIYLAGAFTTAGGLTANRVAKLDVTTETWSAVGIGFNFDAYHLVFNSSGTLFAGGGFDKLSDNTPIPPRVAQWNGTTWSSVGTAGNGGVLSGGMVIGPDGHLYVSGAGTPTPANRVAKWDGSTWSNLNTTSGTSWMTGGSVGGLAFDSDGTLYVAGSASATLTGGVAFRVAKRVGNDWVLVPGLSADPTRLEFRPGLGVVAYNAGDSTNRVVRLDGGSVIGISPGLGSGAVAMETDASGATYFGGSFTQAGCNLSNSFARLSSAPFTGAVNADWHNASNWNGGVPAGSASIVLNAGLVSVSSQDAFIKDLQVGEKATLNIAPGRTLYVSGNLNVLGTIAGGTVVATNCDPNAVTNPGPGYINGTLVRCVNGLQNGTYVFPVGTNNGASGARASNIAGSGFLSVTAVQGPATGTGLPNGKLQRYWTIEDVSGPNFHSSPTEVENPTGGIAQADLSLHYRASDMSGTPSLFRVYRISGGIATDMGGTIDAVRRSATVLGVTQFSDWTLASTATPTSAPAVMGGRVLGTDGRPVANAKVLLTKPDGDVVTVQTNNFGNFRFTGLKAGETYVVMAQTRRDLYMPQVVNLSDNITDLVLRP